jgi:membrane protease YdiL (CAAX protease family)
MPAPLGLGPTLGWGVLALLLMTGAFQPLNVEFPLSLFIGDILKAAGLGLVVFAIWQAGWRVQDYLPVTRLDARAHTLAVRGLLVAGGTVAAYVVASLWLYGVLPASGSNPRVEALASESWFLLLLSTLVGGVVIVPLADELVFRGFLFRGLMESRFGAAGAIVGAAIASGLSHSVTGTGWDWVVLHMIVGLMLGWLRWRTGSITAPLLVHAMINTPVALVVMLMPFFDGLLG